jgi:hypothetical protein
MNLKPTGETHAIVGGIILKLILCFAGIRQAGCESLILRKAATSG